MSSREEELEGHYCPDMSQPLTPAIYISLGVLQSKLPWSLTGLVAKPKQLHLYVQYQ